MSTRVGGRYQLLREIGSGGMGRVFQAIDTDTGRAVAAKVLLASEDVKVQALLRFQREGAVLSALQHPNVVEVYGTFLEEHTSCIIMELLEGQSLAQILRSDGRLPLPRTKKLAQQVAAALAYAHGRGIVHRDIKPSNIMVIGDDQVKVADFGIARVLQEGTTFANLTATDTGMGTPVYMSPEQIEGQRVDGRSDLYSFGVVLYHMVTGKPPFEGPDPLSIAFKHVHKAPQPPGDLNDSLPEDWEALILKCLAKNPAHRYQTATALEEAIAHLEVSDRVTGRRRASAEERDRSDEESDTVAQHVETRRLLEQGKTKERSGDLQGAWRDYGAGLTVAAPGPLRDELEAAIYRITAEMQAEARRAPEAPPETDGGQVAGRLASRAFPFRLGIARASIAALIAAVAVALGVTYVLAHHGRSPQPTRAGTPQAVLWKQYAKYKGLALALQDLPRGSKQTKEQFVTNADVAAETHTPLITVERQGRVISYGTGFSRQILTGVTGVDDDVVVYKTVGMAHAGYTRAVSATRKHNPGRFLAVKRLGDEQAAFISTKRIPGGDATTVIILFRRHVYRAAVSAAGYGERIVRDQAIHFARIMDRRIAERVAQDYPPTPPPAPTSATATPW